MYVCTYINYTRTVCMYIYYLNEASEDFNIESMYSNEDEQGFFAPDSCIIRQAPIRLPVMLEKQQVECRFFLLLIAA